MKILAPLCLAAMMIYAMPAHAADMPQGPMPVSVATVPKQDITRWSEFSGRLRAVEDVEVRPRVSGVVEKVHFREGDIVKQGDKLFTIDTRPFKAAFDQADAALASAQARASLSSSNLSRAQGLFDKKALSQREFDERVNADKEAQAAVKAAEAQRELAALNLEYAELTAPISGRVGRPDITVGNVVQAGQSVLTTIQSVDPVYADFDIDEQTYLRAMKAVRAGRAAEMPVFMELADESEFTREGKIRSFDNQLQGDSGTMRVRAEFANTDGVLTPGLFARIRLGQAGAGEAVLVNDTAVNTDQDRKFVYTVDKEGNVNYQPVVLGALNDGMRIIDQGLSGGENIVVNGLMRVHPGMKVQPMMVDMRTLKPEGGAPEATQDETPGAAPEATEQK